jgi:hypothetical protein
MEADAPFFSLPELVEGGEKMGLERTARRANGAARPKTSLAHQYILLTSCLTTYDLLHATYLLLTYYTLPWAAASLLKFFYAASTRG